MHVYLLEIILLASHNVLFFNYIHVFIVVLLLTVFIYHSKIHIVKRLVVGAI